MAHGCASAIDVSTPRPAGRPGPCGRPRLGARRRLRQLQPVAGRRHGHPQGGLDDRPRQPQPVRRHRAVVSYELYHVELRLPHQLRRQVPRDAARPGRELDQERGRPHLDVQDPPGRDVERRPAAHGQGRRLQLQLPEGPRAHRVPLGARRHQDGHRARRRHGGHRVRQAQGRHPLDVGPHRARAHLERSSRPTTRRPSTSTSPPIVGSGPFQVVEWEKGKFIRCVANKDYWGGKPKVDEIIFQVYKNQDTLAQDLKLGAIDLAINIPPAQVKALKGEAGLDLGGVLAEGLRLPLLQLLRGPVARQPGAQGRQVPPGAQLGGGQGQAHRPRLPDVRRPGDVDLRGRLLRPEPRLALGAAGRGRVRLRPREGQAGARRRRLQGHRRRRHPQRPQERRQGHQAAPLVASASRRRAR